MRLDLSGATGSFDVTWISVSMGVPTRTSATGGYRLMTKTLAGRQGRNARRAVQRRLGCCAREEVN